MKQYKAIIYDLDGTIVDTAYMNIKPLQKMLKIVKEIDYPYEELLPYVAYTGEMILKAFKIEEPEKAYKIWVDEMNNGSYEAIPFENIKEILQKIHQKGIKQAVVSSKYKEQYQIDILDKGIGKYFCSVILAEDTQNHKPHPDPIFACLKELNLSPNEVLYVGDTDSDCRCAHAAGVDFAYASWGPLKISEQVDYYLNQTSDLLKLAGIDSFHEIVVAGGCFWGVQEYYRRLKGIVATQVGYAQGQLENPSYEQVKSQQTNHAEVCRLIFDNSIISIDAILDHLFRIIDPTSLNKQGEDEGTQYRCGVYTTNKNDLPLVLKYVQLQQKNYDLPLVIEVAALTNFYTAEEYHQKYLQKNINGYCHVNFNHLKANEIKSKLKL